MIDPIRQKLQRVLRVRPRMKQNRTIIVTVAPPVESRGKSTF